MSSRQLIRDDALIANVFFVPAPIGHDGFALFANGRF